MATAAAKETLDVVVEFGGGLEMLFPSQKQSLTIPRRDKDDRAVTVAWLIRWLCDEVMQDSRRDMFVLDGHVRPGLLVLINDADWELEGGEAYEMQPGDTVFFVSTLHGG